MNPDELKKLAVEKDSECISKTLMKECGCYPKKKEVEKK